MSFSDIVRVVDAALFCILQVTYDLQVTKVVKKTL